VNFLIKSAPQPVTAPVSMPARSDRQAYGKYLVTMASCGGCHTQEENGQPKMQLAFAGGMEFRFPEFSVRSANITPDGETGIGKWDENRFVEKFRGYANLTLENAPAAVQTNFTLMPWSIWSKLPEDDLRAIYAYLRTVPPIRNAVDPHKPITMQ
jgi:cytochrome c553